MSAVRDHLWLWGHEAGVHDRCFSPPRHSRITPVEAAYYMGIPNMIMVVSGDRPEPPFDQYALAMRPLKQIVWSADDAASTRDDLDAVLKLGRACPNLTGAILDDFFPSENPPRRTSNNIAQYQRQLHSASRPLDLWVVLYDPQHMPNQLSMLEEYLPFFDVFTFWTWKAQNLSRLEENFTQVERKVGNKRKILGCYMYDYGGYEKGSREIPLDLMKYQCETGLTWLEKGRIDGMIFLASCICDLTLKAVEWTRQWIAQVADRPLPNANKSWE
jgi:hypothetical protein